MIKSTTRILMAAALLVAARSAFGGNAYTSTTDSSWFNGDNWANNPTNLNGSTTTDDDIFGGQGFASLAPDGVIFDPVNDANYQANTSYDFNVGGSNPTTGTARTFVTIPQLYLAGGSGSANGDIAGKLTVKSGTLTITGGSTGLGIGRPQLVNPSQNTSLNAELVVTGGTVTTTASNGDISLGTSQTTGTALGLSTTNTLDYTNGGTITATSKTGGGLRMGVAAVASGFTQSNNLILRHTSAGTGSLNFGSVLITAQSATSGTVNNTVEFHYGGGNVDTVNVGTGTAGNTLKITNDTVSGGGTVNSYLSLLLDDAPSETTDNRVQDLGLFKVENSGNTIGASATDATKEFKDLNGNALTEGATVSAILNGTTYSWNIYYDGDINGSSISGAGTGNDVVLIGQAYPTAAVPEPASLGLLALGGLALLARRRKA